MFIAIRLEASKKDENTLKALITIIVVAATFVISITKLHYSATDQEPLQEDLDASVHLQKIPKESEDVDRSTQDDIYMLKQYLTSYSNIELSAETK